MNRWVVLSRIIAMSLVVGGMADIGGPNFEALPWREALVLAIPFVGIWWRRRTLGA